MISMPMNKLFSIGLLIIAPVISAPITTSMAIANTALAPRFIKTDDPNFDIVGEAFSLEDQRLLYREYHQVDGNMHVVIYRDPSGKEFSRKTIDYSFSQQAPSFKQHNHWSGETIAVDNTTGAISLSYRNASKETDSTETLITNNTLIIDAGFNRYIQNNWSALTDGKAAVFDFALADRQDLIALEIERSDCQLATANGVARSRTEATDSQPNGAKASTQKPMVNIPSSTKAKSKANTVCFSIGADNRLIRWLIGSLDLVYAQDSRQLLRFTGLANINDQQGKGLKVDIHYYYPPSAQQVEP